MNHILLVVVVAAVLLFGAMQLGARRLARRAQGRRAPDTGAVDGPIPPDALRVYYFHAPHCGPCRSMTPLVDEVRASHPHLIKVDVSQAPELARGFGVVATPSFAVVDGGVIQHVSLGTQSRSALARMLRIDAKAG
ncbi:MAG: thioredoxin family protein [Betaproteobacteria bacterium]|nr:thioredoxin family protein [Betaproteobacteria bacterium]MBU6512892.1 thioredoxin family protein [Betaproteobacteria bacterium]MDE1955728.1 thioredoxin family protein [Betaproteobacteria bacterium]MDE2154086.1 thioredoxin family protein [Betaproteobacteria bacterium]MDE2478587.1 thioredoxin family protein [Betaproteobacteria bacterium]